MTVDDLLPGRFATARLQADIRYNTAKLGIEPEELRWLQIPAGRCAPVRYVCPAQAGYIVGQPLPMDGVEVPGRLWGWR